MKTSAFTSVPLRERGAVGEKKAGRIAPARFHYMATKFDYGVTLVPAVPVFVVRLLV